MDVSLHMYITEKDKFGTKSFDLLAIIAGDVNKLSPELILKNRWREKDDDESLLAIGVTIERGLMLNYLTIYKVTDAATAKLIRAEQKGKLLFGKIDVMVYSPITFGTVRKIWKGSYSFDFKVKRIYDDLETESADYRFDYAILKIIDKTEELSLPES